MERCTAGERGSVPDGGDWPQTLPSDLELAGATTILPTASLPRLKYLCAFPKQISRTMFPRSFSSLGSSPFSTSRPIKLQRTRRKYSCRGKDINERESVTMPMNRDNKPVFESVFSCHSMPSF